MRFIVRMQWIAILALLMGLEGMVQAEDTPLRQVQSIELPKVEGRIDHMCLSADGRKLFVAALGNDSVEIVDIERGVHAGSIGHIKEPQGVAYILGSGRLAVASGQDDQCRIYDQALALVGAVHDLPDADNVRYDPSAKLLYVGYGEGAAGAMAVIDPDKPAKLAEIKLDGHPESFQLEAQGKRIFVNVPTARQIAVIDREKRAVIARWPVKNARANFPMALDEPNHRLFVGCREPAKLLVVDTESGRVVAALDCTGDTDDVFYDATRKRVYVSGGAGAGSVSIFEETDPDHYGLLDTVPTAPGARTSLLVPAGDRLFVAVPHRGAQKAEIRVFQTAITGPARAALDIR